LALKRTHETLGVPLEYIPLDSFEGESGFFYNKLTDEVIELSLDGSLAEFQQGSLKPHWASFNDFLEGFFELS
jgi:hypothetical protein